MRGNILDIFLQHNFFFYIHFEKKDIILKGNCLQHLTRLTDQQLTVDMPHSIHHCPVFAFI